MDRGLASLGQGGGGVLLTLIRIFLADVVLTAAGEEGGKAERANIFDSGGCGNISVKTRLMNVDYSAFEGWSLEGRSDAVTVRGKIAVLDGKFIGDPTRGAP